MPKHYAHGYITLWQPEKKWPEALFYYYHLLVQSDYQHPYVDPNIVCSDIPIYNNSIGKEGVSVEIHISNINEWGHFSVAVMILNPL